MSPRDPMTPEERLRSLVSEFSVNYLIIMETEEGPKFIINDFSFARSCLDDLPDAIDRAEHHEAQRESRETRRNAKDDRQEPQEPDKDPESGNQG